MPIKEDREYRRINVQDLETRSEDNSMIVEGYATTFNQEYTLYEYDGYRVVESVDSRAFDNTDMNDVIMQYDHQGRVFARIKNGTLQITPDEHGLHIRADLGGTEIGRQLYEEIKGGYTDKMSFGFTVSNDERTETTEDEVRVIHRQITGIKKLYDVSAVSLPANESTEIYSARSFAEGVIAEARKEIAVHEAHEKQKQRIRILMGVSNNDD